MPPKSKPGFVLEGSALKHRPAKVVRADIAQHTANRPHWTDINGLTKWALRKEALECELAVAERRMAARWVDVPGRKGMAA